MKHTLFILLFSVTLAPLLRAQSDKQRKDITSLINKYSEAREKRDTVLLKNILTPDVDQLVSTGEWRNGIDASVKGMLNSSASAPGTRTLTVEKIRMLNPDIAIVDCKYEITDTGGTARKMWSTFVIVLSKGVWKISAIRNMLPAGQTPQTPSEFLRHFLDDVLTISAENKSESSNKGDNNRQYSRREYSYSSFTRSFSLPENAKDDSISANYQDGILRLNIPKSEVQTKPSKEIRIE